MHKTRSQISKLWPVPRKGNRFMVVANHNRESGIPLLIVLREILKLGKTRKEIKKIILTEKIKINGKVIKDEKYPLSLYDILSIDAKSYRVAIKNKKFSLEENKTNDRISKIIGKKILGKSLVQINLDDGRNFLSKEKMNVGDSIVFDFKDKKILKVIALKSGAEVLVTGGSHIGETGKVEKIEGRIAEVKLDSGKVNLETKRLMAV